MCGGYKSQAHQAQLGFQKQKRLGSRTGVCREISGLAREAPPTQEPLSVRASQSTFSLFTSTQSITLTACVNISSFRVNRRVYTRQDIRRRRDLDKQYPPFFSWPANRACSVSPWQLAVQTATATSKSRTRPFDTKLGRRQIHNSAASIADVQRRCRLQQAEPPKHANAASRTRSVTAGQPSLRRPYRPSTIAKSFERG